MSELLEALERADQALQDIVDMDPVDAVIVNDAYVAQGNMEKHIKELKEELFEKEVKRMNEWNRSFQYRPRHQEEMRTP